MCGKSLMPGSGRFGFLKPSHAARFSPLPQGAPQVCGASKPTLLHLKADAEAARVYADAYNANPLSTAASLRTLAAIQGQRRIALLGDMLELGTEEAAGHQDMVTLARSLNLDLIGLAGPCYTAALNTIGAPDGIRVADTAEALGAQLYLEDEAKRGLHTAYIAKYTFSSSK